MIVTSYKESQIKLQIDRGILRVYDGNYDRYLESKAHQAEVEQRTRHNHMRFYNANINGCKRCPEPEAQSQNQEFKLSKKLKTNSPKNSSS